MHRLYLHNKLNETNYNYSSLSQEITKVRERILGIGLIRKVIPLKLFLDMVPSSSEDVTPVMRE